MYLLIFVMDHDILVSRIRVLALSFSATCSLFSTLHTFERFENTCKIFRFIRMNYVLRTSTLEDETSYLSCYFYPHHVLSVPPHPTFSRERPIANCFKPKICALLPPVRLSFSPQSSPQTSLSFSLFYTQSPSVPLVFPATQISLTVIEHTARTSTINHAYEHCQPCQHPTTQAGTTIPQTASTSVH